MADTKSVLTLAVELGEAMLHNGGEIFRVEDTITRILKAYEIEDFDVYVLANGIFASASEHRVEASSMIRHVPLAGINFKKVAALNQLARDICSFDCSLEDAWVKLEACKQLPDYRASVFVVFAGIGAGAFCFLFGGRWLDMLFACLIGMLEEGMLLFFQKRKLSRFLQNLCASLVATFCSIFVMRLGLPVLHDKIVIGAIMLLVPGVAFTTAIRDYYNGDHLSGTIHLMDALLTGTIIALGVCIATWCCSYLGGGALFS